MWGADLYNQLVSYYFELWVEYALHVLVAFWSGLYVDTFAYLGAPGLVVF